MKKACKQCRALTDGGMCPVCKNTDFANSWNGRIILLDPSNSAIAKRLSVNAAAEYAIKTR